MSSMMANSMKKYRLRISNLKIQIMMPNAITFVKNVISLKLSCIRCFGKCELQINKVEKVGFSFNSL